MCLILRRPLLSFLEFKNCKNKIKNKFSYSLPQTPKLFGSQETETTGGCFLCF